MGDLSTHFSAYEFACSCGCGEQDMDVDFITELQELRNLVNAPIVVTSGFRCKKHNESIGGAKNSYHLKGWAADIHIKGLSVIETFVAAEQLYMFRNGGIGIYDGNFIHVDRRNGHKRWGRIGGTYVDFAKALKQLA